MLDGINDGLRRTLDFKGKSNKLQYNSMVLFYFVLNFFTMTFNPTAKNLNSFIWLMSLVPMIAAQIRRSHDIGRSGWWIIIPFYPIYLMFKDSKPDEVQPPVEL